MKEKRIWIVIGCILLIGSGVTYYTNSYVKGQAKGGERIEEASSDGGSPEAFGTLESIGPEEESNSVWTENEGTLETGLARKGRIAGEPLRESRELPLSEEDGNGKAGLKEEVREGDPDGEGSKASVPEEGVTGARDSSETAEDMVEAIPISPLTGARTRSNQILPSSDCKQRLKDLDHQIQKIRESEGADSSSNLYSIKTSAETELKLWEGEMGAVYNGLLEMLSQEDAAALAVEQQEWLQKRDLKAAEGTSRSNGSVDRLGYTAILVSLTRERAYELADRCEEVNGSVKENEKGS